MGAMEERASWSRLLKEIGKCMLSSLYKLFSKLAELF
jgi:hypothetical protein